MDPNNNQPINTNPLGQPSAPEAVATAFPASTVPPAQEPTAVTPVAAPVPPPTPKSGGKKGIVLFLILFILVLGMVFYVFFAKNQLETAKKTQINNTSSIAPTATITPIPTPATAEEINVASPEADLNDIEKDIQGL